ncbi:MAG: aspartyl protease family protein [Candidatus Rokubacteria bacterium]|nr:aspartyl protease family protein [Candidatus Rokubacteria bacterium]
MRSLISLTVGVLIGQWLVFSGTTSPANVRTLGMLAFERQDYAEAARIWSHAVTLEPDNATYHYLRGTALARLGHDSSAVDAYRQALLLEPPDAVARGATEGLRHLLAARAATTGSDAVVPLEASRGVWIAHVMLNDRRTGRFLVDTGASVTLVSPALARALDLRPAGDQTTQLQTVAGNTIGSTAVLASVRLGDIEARDVTAVIHDPGLDLDGILGNSFLGRFTFTLDADRRLLHLKSVAP